MLNAIMQKVKDSAQGSNDKHINWLRAHTKNEIEIIKKALKLHHYVVDSESLENIEGIAWLLQHTFATQHLNQDDKNTLRKDAVESVESKFNQIINNIEHSSSR